MANPAFQENILEEYSYADEQVMTVTGAVNRSLFLTTILMLTGTLNAFIFFYVDPSIAMTIATVSGIAGFITALVVIFKQKTVAIKTPIIVYAVFEGLALGGISSYYEAVFSGIVIQAVSITALVLFIMLFLYKYRIIKVTETFKSVIIGATMAVAVFYLIAFVLSLFNMPIAFLYGNSNLAIGINAAIAGLAAFNLLLDFDFIERGANQNLPKFFEWYAGFGLLVTLVWLYLEILKLLSKLRSRKN